MEKALKPAAFIFSSKSRHSSGLRLISLESYSVLASGLTPEVSSNGTISMLVKVTPDINHLTYLPREDEQPLPVDHVAVGIP